MYKTKEWENLKHILDELYCETVHPILRDYTESWDFNKERKIIMTHKDGTKDIQEPVVSVKMDYSRVLNNCIDQFKREIENNVISHDKLQKIEYLNDIVRYCGNLIGGYEAKSMAFQIIRKKDMTFSDGSSDLLPIQLYSVQELLKYLTTKYNSLLSESINASLSLTTTQNLLIDKKRVEPSLKVLALYYNYIGKDVNKENSTELLKNTKHKSGAKLKQLFDFFQKTSNRINEDTERKNQYRIKDFERVIELLKKTDNKQAIQKAIDEYNTFKTKLA